jgi:hypothetical protein
MDRGVRARFAHDSQKDSFSIHHSTYAHPRQARQEDWKSQPQNVDNVIFDGFIVLEFQRFVVLLDTDCPFRRQQRLRFVGKLQMILFQRCRHCYRSGVCFLVHGLDD